MPRGPALLVEISLLDLIVPLVVAVGEPGVAVLVPGGLTGLVEEVGLDHVTPLVVTGEGAREAVAAIEAPFHLPGEPAPLVVLPRQPGVAVLVPRGPAVLVEVGPLRPVAPLVVADIISGVAGGGVEAPAGLLDQFAPLIVPPGHAYEAGVVADGPARLVERDDLDQVAPLVVLAGVPGVAVLVTGGPACSLKLANSTRFPRSSQRSMSLA